MLRSEGTQYVPSSNVTAKTDNDTNAEEFFDQVEESVSLNEFINSAKKKKQSF